jgi:hypothetical protein
MKKMTYDRQISSYDIARALKAQRALQMSDMIGAFVRSLFARKPMLRPMLG